MTHVGKATTLLDTARPKIINVKHPAPEIGSSFRLTIQFNESLDPDKKPLIILRSTGQKDPIVSLEGRFMTTTLANDTYLTPKITLDRFGLSGIDREGFISPDVR